jgi:hypothetical protein
LDPTRQIIAGFSHFCNTAEVDNSTLSEAALAVKSKLEAATGQYAIKVGGFEV